MSVLRKGSPQHQQDCVCLIWGPADVFDGLVPASNERRARRSYIHTSAEVDGPRILLSSMPPGILLYVNLQLMYQNAQTLLLSSSTLILAVIRCRAAQYDVTQVTRTAHPSRCSGSVNARAYCYSGRRSSLPHFVLNAAVAPIRFRETR